MILYEISITGVMPDFDTYLSLGRLCRPDHRTAECVMPDFDTLHNMLGVDRTGLRFVQRTSATKRSRQIRSTFTGGRRVLTDGRTFTGECWVFPDGCRVFESYGIV